MKEKVAQMGSATLISHCALPPQPVLWGEGVRMLLNIYKFLIYICPLPHATIRPSELRLSGMHIPRHLFAPPFIPRCTIPFHPGKPPSLPDGNYWDERSQAQGEYPLPEVYGKRPRSFLPVNFWAIFQNTPTPKSPMVRKFFGKFRRVPRPWTTIDPNTCAETSNNVHENTK
jgi:hypothetical protein